MRLEVLEELPQDALGLLVLGLGRAGEVHVVEHELPERVARLEHLRAHRHRRLAVARDDDVVDHRVEPLAAGGPERGADLARDVVIVDDPGAHRVVDVVVEVRDLVRVPHGPALGGVRLAPGRGLEAAFGRSAVLEDAVARLDGEVKALAAALEALDDPDALLVVTEALGEEASEELLTDVAERRVADVVAEGHRLDEILIEPERDGHRAADLAHLEDVREARAVVVADRREEDLRLVLRAPERLAVDDPVAVDLEGGPCRRGLFRAVPPRGGRSRRGRRQELLFVALDGLADAQRGHLASAREASGERVGGSHGHTA